MAIFNSTQARTNKSNSPRAKKRLDRSTFVVPGLVNRQRVIATLKDKANITGYRWSPPRKKTDRVQENRSKDGTFLHYADTRPVTIRDVDGKDKQTTRTTYYAEDKRTRLLKPAPFIGEWVDGLAGHYHGRRSLNWKQENLTLGEIIAVLNAGYAFAPGFYNPPDGESRRSADYCEHRQIILFDGDEWTEQHPASVNFDEMLSRYPDLATDFYWIGESISSRSSLKPELRTRLMLVLPEPIRKGETDLWQTAVDWVVTKYPFIARGVGIDRVRLSFGNARPECDNRVLGGVVSQDTFAEWQQIASQNQAKAEALRIEAEKQRAEREARREKNNALKTKLKTLGYDLTENKDPIREFCDVDAARLLGELRLANHLSGKSWHWYDSSPGRSFELENGIIKPFSNTMQSNSPETDGTKIVNAHRFILYYLHKLDMTKNTDQRELRCILADAGYGTHPDNYKKSKRTDKVAGVREGLISPLELRKSAPPLPTEEKQTERIFYTLTENALVIAKAFKQKSRVVGLRSGTGEGKTQSVIFVAEKGKHVAMTLPSLPVAEQVHERFLDANCGSVLWQSRFYGYNSEDGVSGTKITRDAPYKVRKRAFDTGSVICVNPILCKASQKRGIPAPIGVCQNCPVQTECQKVGYLSQIPAAQNTHVLTIAQPKLFIDPAFAGFFKQLSRGQPKDCLYVIDEAKAHDMFIDCTIDKEQLQQWVRDWNGEKLGSFAEVALQILEVKTQHPYQIAAFVKDFDEDDIAIMARQASHFRLAYTRVEDSKSDPETGNTLAYHAVRFQGGQTAFVAVDSDAYERFTELDISAVKPIEISDTGHLTLTPSQAFRLGIYNNKTPEDFAEIPRIYEKSKWTFFQQIRLFAERYQRQEDAPIWYHEGTLHWVIPPVLHRRVKHLVCMGASLQHEGFERACDSEKVVFIETPPTHWVDGARAFQVRTGAYPRTSLLEYTLDWKKVVGLSKTGKHFVDLIETEIKRDRNIKHVIITVKAIVDMLGSELISKHSNLLDVLSFHKMEGLDYKEAGMVFWILGCPNVKLDVSRNRAKIIYGNDTVPLCHDYDKEKGVYVDRRLQLCWESEVSALLTQANGRARLNRLANTVIALTNILIPDFTDRAIGFVPEDLEVAGGLDNLAEVAEARMEAEKKSSKTEKKTARQREQEARELKVRQKNEVYRLYNTGMNKVDISKQTGVSRPTIDKWLDEFSF